MQTPSIVLFDWDNTLSDTFPSLHDSYNHMLRHYGMDEWDEVKAKKNIRLAAQEYLPTLFGDKWREALDMYRTYYRSKYHHTLPFESAVEVMDALKAKGVRMGVISNKHHAIVTDLAASSPYAAYLEVVYGGHDDWPGKPDPTLMDMALEQLGYDGPRDDVWYVGDTSVDMEFARNAGTKAVFVEHAGLDTLDAIEKSHKPDLAFKDLNGFLAYLSG